MKSQGSGCGKCARAQAAAALRLDPEEAAAVIREAGYEPLAPYPGSSGKPWPCRCLTCDSSLTPSYDNVKQGYRCSPCARRAQGERQRGKPRPGVNDWRRVPPDAAERVMLAARLEPMEPFTEAAAPWPCRCLDCGLTSRPSYHSVRKGTRCRYCSRNMPRDAVVYVMEHRHMNAVKIGVCGLRPGDTRRRTRTLIREGWQLVREYRTDVATAYRLEGAVLRHLRDERGLGPYLTPEWMPHSGYTETFDADLITALEIWRLVQQESTKGGDSSQ